MFDFDAGKLLIIGVVALIVIGPKELPRVLRQVGQTVARVRRMAAEFQGQFMDAMKEADIESIREDLKKIGDQAELNVAFDPARDIQRELTTSLDRPAVAAELPAMADTPAGATDGFSLPHLPEMPGEIAGEPIVSLAGAGIGPAAEPEPASVAPDPEPGPAMNGVDVFAAAKKRKIRLPKRAGVSVNRTHVVTDRTTPARVRLAQGRRQEVAGS